MPSALGPQSKRPFPQGSREKFKLRDRIKAPRIHGTAQRWMRRNSSIWDSRCEIHRPSRVALDSPKSLTRRNLVLSCRSVLLRAGLQPHLGPDPMPQGTDPLHQTGGAAEEGEADDDDALDAGNERQCLAPPPSFAPSVGPAAAPRGPRALGPSLPALARFASNSDSLSLLQRAWVACGSR